MVMPSQFTKGHGSLGQRCGLLSNYFDLLFCCNLDRFVVCVVFHVALSLLSTKPRD